MLPYRFIPDSMVSLITCATDFEINRMFPPCLTPADACNCKACKTDHSCVIMTHVDPCKAGQATGRLSQDTHKHTRGPCLADKPKCWPVPHSILVAVQGLTPCLPVRQDAHNAWSSLKQSQPIAANYAFLSQPTSTSSCALLSTALSRHALGTPLLTNARDCGHVIVGIEVADAARLW